MESFTKEDFESIDMFHKLRESGLTYNEIKLLSSFTEVLKNIDFEGQEKIFASRTRAQLAEAIQHITKTADEISRSDFKPTPGKHCDFCEFRLICEAWQ